MWLLLLTSGRGITTDCFVMASPIDDHSLSQIYEVYLKLIVSV